MFSLRMTSFMFEEILLTIKCMRVNLQVVCHLEETAYNYDS